MICKHCKTVNPEDAVFCRHCGERLKSKWVPRWVIVVSLFFFVIIASVIAFVISLKHSPHRDVIPNDTIYVDTADIAMVDTFSANGGEKKLSDEGDAPLSMGEIEDGRGGYDDNAEGYFNMFANDYADNHDVYFEGYFENSKKSYPIMLKFELDDNWHAGVCYYHNIDYNAKLKMNVRFTEEEMIIRGIANGSDFIMRFTPTSDGKWRGTAQCGKSCFDASIVPVNR